MHLAPDPSACPPLPAAATGPEKPATPTEVTVPVPEEALVADARAGLTPAQLVERKLISLLKSNPLRISHVQMMATGLSRTR
jgi:hypothetical protein